MTKEQFINKWWLACTTTFIDDLELVIATEIVKVQPEKTNKIEITPHTLVEVNRAFRALKQDRNSYIHKVFSDDGVFDAMNEIRKVYEAHYGPKKEEQPKLDPIEAWKQYKEENKPQPALNPIAEAYERGEKIRYKNWLNGDWIQKHKETKTIDNNGYLNSVFTFGFIQDPENWELYTEPTEQTAQPSSQAKLDNSFNKDRFEAMFRAVVASGRYDIKTTEQALERLDAYYAEKEKGGNNG